MASGKRVGERPKRAFRPALLLLALGVTASVVAWGYLVLAAIDFGTAARDGDAAAWGFLALASLGAVACLFVGLILVSRISRALGLTSAASAAPTERATDPDEPEQPPRTPGAGRHGGHRAAGRS